MYFVYFLCYLIIVINVESDAYLDTCKPVIALDTPPLIRIPGVASFRGSATVSYRRQRIIYQYLGIPFALPPMGGLRFKPPVPLKQLNENEVYDAKYFKPKCPQLVNKEDYEYLRKNSDKAEDCLYLNVFTIVENGTKQDPLLPVLINIHGGGYYQGSALDFCPNYLLDHDFILVTLQYRLGPLGFLSFNDENVSGNMGLLDQLEAIEWVHKNIKYFGGDNQRITLSGQSSGATSVSLMLVSPLVRPGLFHQVIVQSGNLFGEWSIDYNPKEHAIEYASYSNCSDTDMKKLLECLISVPTFDLIRTNYQYMNERAASRLQIIKEIGINHATIQSTGSKIFLSEDPREKIKRGKFQKLPMITGVTKDEGSMIIEAFVDYVFDSKFHPTYQVTESQIQYLKNNLFSDFVKFNGVSDDEYHLIEMAEDTYIPDRTRSNFNDTVPGLVDLSGTLVLKSQVLKLARQMYQYTPVYLYSFNYKGTKTKLGYGGSIKHVYFDGVAHSDDLIYLFPHTDHIPNNEEKNVIEDMTDLWASFIMNGGNHISTPDLPKWPIMSTFNGPYLQITDKLKINDNFLREYRNHVNDPKSASSSIDKLPFLYCLGIIRLVFILC